MRPAKENHEGQRQPNEKQVVLDMRKLREQFFARINEEKILEERQEIRSYVRETLLADPGGWTLEDIPFYLKTEDQASEELFDNVLDHIFRNFPAEEGGNILELFVNKMLKRLFEEEKDEQKTEE